MDLLENEVNINNRNLFTNLEQLLISPGRSLTDVTLVGNDGSSANYKMLLATISPMLSDIFDNNKCQPPNTIIFPDFSREDISQFLTSCLNGTSFPNLDLIQLLEVDAKYLSSQQSHDFNF